MHRKTILIALFSALGTLAEYSSAAPATMEHTSYLGAPAIRLSDGKTEAVIVPGFSARIMRYGKVGGRNWLWNSGPNTPGEKWTNLGGDKCFIGPHRKWSQFSPQLWPPPFPSWDGASHKAEELPGARLRTTGPLWNGFEARVVREFSFDGSGALVIEQRIEKLGTSPVFMSAWTVSQAAPPDAVFIPLNPESAYVGGFYRWKPLPAGANVKTISPSLLRLIPTTGKSYKIGTDSRVPAIAAVAENTVWLQQAEPQEGDYPDGPDGAGFPVEYYNHDAAGTGHYVELELLSTRRVLKKGESLTLTVRWSLHPLNAGDFSKEEAEKEIEALLRSTPG